MYLKMNNKIIDQTKNHAADFGLISRSSGIFYCPAKIKTTVTFMNYFMVKNGTIVLVVATRRDMSGKVIKRFDLDFDKKNVINIEVNDDKDSSIELEFFSNKNLRIPYAAVMVVYESNKSVSMVHNYGRNHSLIELEDDHSILEGNETCWFISDFGRVSKGTNFSVFHNGHIPIPSQAGEVTISQKGVEDLVINFPIPSIESFETFKFDIYDICYNEITKIKNKPTWISLSFKSLSSFPRLLVIEKAKNGEFQVAHSDIDYSKVGTNIIDGSKSFCKAPRILGQVQQASLDIDPGRMSSQISYQVDNGDSIDLEGGGELVDLSSGLNITFDEKNGKMPSRLHTALVGKFKEENSLPFKSCLGSLHDERPPKHTHWVHIKPSLKSKLYLTSYPELYSEGLKNIELSFKLFNSKSTDVIEEIKKYKNIDEVPQIIEPESIFSNYNNFIGDDFGYILINSSYGGFLIYTSISDGQSFSIEHTF
tara:strand:+ start:483 stop:1922 length:1440 start_codon:yes stop_codon:yes gene_type:complete